MCSIFHRNFIPKFRRNIHKNCLKYVFVSELQKSKQMKMCDEKNTLTSEQKNILYRIVEKLMAKKYDVSQQIISTKKQSKFDIWKWRFSQSARKLCVLQPPYTNNDFLMIFVLTVRPLLLWWCCYCLSFWSRRKIHLLFYCVQKHVYFPISLWFRYLCGCMQGVVFFSHVSRYRWDFQNICPHSTRYTIVWCSCIDIALDSKTKWELRTDNNRTRQWPKCWIIFN